MMMVVTNPILVKRRRPGWLDASDDGLFGQDPEGVVNRLSGNRTDLGSNNVGDFVCRAMGADTKPRAARPGVGPLQAPHFHAIDWQHHSTCRQFMSDLDYVKIQDMSNLKGARRSISGTKTSRREISQPEA